jgi:hypothetical protein
MNAFEKCVDEATTGITNPNSCDEGYALNTATMKCEGVTVKISSADGQRASIYSVGDYKTPFTNAHGAVLAAKDVGSVKIPAGLRVVLFSKKNLRGKKATFKGPAVVISEKKALLKSLKVKKVKSVKGQSIVSEQQLLTAENLDIHSNANEEALGYEHVPATIGGLDNLLSGPENDEDEETSDEDFAANFSILGDEDDDEDPAEEDFGRRDGPAHETVASSAVGASRALGSIFAFMTATIVLCW